MAGLVALANITLGTTASTVTFSSITGSYKDLYLVVSAAGFAGNSGLFVRINGDTGFNYNYVGMQADGSSAYKYTNFGYNALVFGGYVSLANNAVLTLNFMDYSATDKQKNVLGRSSDASYAVGLDAGRWANTAAITSFVLYPSSNTFSAGSTFALYGVSA